MAPRRHPVRTCVDPLPSAGTVTRRTGGLTAAALSLLAVATLAGCGRRLQATAIQPHPLGATTETLAASERLFIDVRDMELPRQFILRNSAYFVVASPDRLRFHVTLVHKWEEMTDVRGWEVFLEDDRGRRFRPESKEIFRNRHITRMWDRELRSTRRNAFGDIVSVRNDGHRRRVSLASADVYRGEGDYVFHHPRLMDRSVRKLALVMKREGLEYRYEWRFSDHIHAVEHHGQGLTDEGSDLRPGPVTGNR